MTLWSVILRQILLSGGFFGGDAAALKASYETAKFTDATLTRNNAEMSLAAVCDSIIQAMSLIVSAIGQNRESNYRAYFLDETAPVPSGGAIPKLSKTNVPRIGLIRNVREWLDPTAEDYDATVPPRELTHQPNTLITIANKQHLRLQNTQYHYYTDDVRIWLTVPFAVLEIVAWDISAERAAVYTDNDTKRCPLPTDLLPALEFGTLSFLYRDTFNVELATANWQKFALELNRIAGKPIADSELPSKA